MHRENHHLRLVSARDELASGDWTGRIIDDRYRVEGILGEGGTGIVYRAEHVVLHKPVAIKVLRADVSRNEAVVRRFLQEARSASSIGNQHIVDVVDFGILEDSSAYLVMEYLQGQTLSEIIFEAQRAQSVLSLARCLHIAQQLCSALAAAHEIGVVHRDLKPDNIHLIEQGDDPDFVKVLDFGTAKVMHNSARWTRQGQVIGTLHYMSPEQCSGEEVDGRADIYALGVILYEMLTGTVPFEASNLVGVLNKHLQEAPLPPSQRAPQAQIPEALERIVLRCLEKDPGARYATVLELQQALHHFLGEHPEARYDPKTQPRLRLSRPENDPVDSSRRSGFPFVGKAWIWGLGLVGMLSGVVWAWWSGPESATNRVNAMRQHKVEVAPKLQRSAALPKVAHLPGTPQEEAQSPTITLWSEPEGAEVWSGRELLGNTPLALPRPAEGVLTNLELRKAGFRSQLMQVSARTAAEVRLSLRRKPPVRKASVVREKAAESPAEEAGAKAAETDAPAS